MILNSDINLIHPLWERADNELCDNSELGIFNRLVDVYVLACAIGIKEDKTLTEIENPLENSMAWIDMNGDTISRRRLAFSKA